MNARKYLETILDTEQRIQLKTEQIARMQDSLTSLTAPMDKEQVTHTKNVAVMAQTVAKIVDIEKELDMQAAVLMSRKATLFRLMDKLSAADASILNERYILGKTPGEIGEQRCISQRSVFRRLSDAISNLQGIMIQEEEI